MRTPFYELEEALGAEFQEEAGWIVPAAYAPMEQEYWAVRKAVGLVDLTGRGRILVGGKERVRFLQSMLSQDVAGLPVGRGAPATLLTNKGRMLGLLRVYNLGDAYLLDVEPRAAEKTRRTLEGYKMALRVEITDVTESLVALSLQGPRARQLLAKAFELAPEHEEEIVAYPAQELLARWGEATEPCVHPHMWIARVSHTGEQGYDVFVDRAMGAVLWRVLWESGQELGLRAVGLRALSVLRLEAGIPWYGFDVDETTIPLEAGLESALSFTKGCYIGQETIAMIRYRGHINRKLVGLRFERGELPHSGDHIFAEGADVGWITSAAVSLSLGVPIALGYVKCAWADPGTPVRVRRAADEVEAEVCSLPFLSPGELTDVSPAQQ